MRDLTRYRMKTVQARTSEIQRLGKALESAGIKLGSVASSITGASATAMIEALIDGERRGGVLADLAIGRMRDRREAGRPVDGADRPVHRASRAAVPPAPGPHRRASTPRSPAWMSGSRARLTRWQREAGLLTSVPGFGDVVAQAWLGEIGPAPHLHFATHEKLASWVTLCPGNNISARKRKHGRTGDAGTYIKPMLVQAAWAAIRVRGRLQARYNRLVRRFGGDKNPGAKKKAIIAIAHTLLKIAYQVLKSGTPYQEPGADFYTRRESPRAEAGLAGAPAAKAAPGLHHHHHHQPAGGRLSTRRLTTSPVPAQPRSRRQPGTRPFPPDNQRHPLALAAAQAKVRCRAPTGDPDLRQ